MEEAVNTQNSYVSYRWVMLGLAWVISASGGWVGILAAPLAKQVMADLNMDHGMFMVALGAPAIMSIFLSLPGGILSDRFGMKKMILLAGLISGASGIFRGLSSGYLQFFFFSIISGFGITIMMPNMAKLVREWFPPRQIGIATGIWIAAASAGMALGLGATYPIFGFDWRLAFFILSGFQLLGIAAWHFLAKENIKVKVKEIKRHSMMQDLSLIVRNSDVWMCTGMRIFGNGSFMLILRLLPVAFQNARSVAPAVTGFMASMAQIGVICGNMCWPMISDRIGRRKPLLILCPVLGAISLLLTWNLSFGVQTFVFNFFVGLFISGCLTALPLAILTEHPRIPTEVVGTAVGFSTSLHFTGLYIIGTLGGYIVEWTSGYDASFLTAAILVMVVPVFGTFVREKQSMASNHATS
jgi:MFS family permease